MQPITETVSAAGVRFEATLHDEGIEWPDRAELYNPDYPVVYLAAVQEVRNRIEAAVVAQARRMVSALFGANPIDIERPRTAQEIRFERLREGRGTISDAVLEGAKLKGPGVPAEVAGGGYGKAPW